MYNSNQFYSESSNDYQLHKNLIKSKRALVVDDDLAMTELIARMLIRENFRVDICCDGWAALEKLAHEHFDFVVMDWSLPGISGGEILQKTDRWNDQDSLASGNRIQDREPVVILSGLSMNQIHFPVLEKFEILEFWPKQMGYKNLQQKIKKISQKRYVRG